MGSAPLWLDHNVLGLSDSVYAINPNRDPPAALDESGRTTATAPATHASATDATTIAQARDDRRVPELFMPGLSRSLVTTSQPGVRSRPPRERRNQSGSARADASSAHLGPARVVDQFGLLLDRAEGRQRIATRSRPFRLHRCRYRTTPPEGSSRLRRRSCFRPVTMSAMLHTSVLDDTTEIAAVDVHHVDAGQ